MEKRKVKLLKRLENGIYSQEKINLWIIDALDLIQNNLAMVYLALPKKEDKQVKCINTLLGICKKCQYKDLKTNGTCDCECHKNNG